MMPKTIKNKSVNLYDYLIILMAVIYGLAVATVLTLVVVPAMYMILGRKEEYFEEHRHAKPQV